MGCPLGGFQEHGGFFIQGCQNHVSGQVGWPSKKTGKVRGLGEYETGRLWENSFFLPKWRILRDDPDEITGVEWIDDGLIFGGITPSSNFGD